MAHAMVLRFTGAAGTVTGSHYVLDTGAARLLLDCGLYQGAREWRERNWQPFPAPPASIEAAVISHAHIDHTGYLPRLLRDGFPGPVYATAATRELCEILLPDSARLMKEEADYRNRKGATTHTPALPLYTEQDAERAVQRIASTALHAPLSLPGGATVRLQRAGHLLGSAMIRLEYGGTSLLFTGDLGRAHPVMLAPPETVAEADYLMLESTYGNRLHEEGHPGELLRRSVQRVCDQGGVLVIPAFAVGRTQEVLYLLRQLELSGSIPALPVYVDSPMATDATEILMRHPEELAPEVAALGPSGLRPHYLRFTRTVEESKTLNAAPGPMIVIAASGMATGGRVLHHLRHRLPDPRNSVLLVGYQPEGSRGRQLLDGAASVRIFHEDIPVRARIDSVDALSAHADANEILAWLHGFSRPPRRTFLVHGENDARSALAERITRELGWDVRAPALGEQAELA